MNLYFVILLLIIFVIWAIFKWSFNYWKKRGVYTPTPSFPFGNAKNTITQKCCIGIEIMNVYNDFKQKSLGFGGYYFLTFPILVLVDLELIKKILINDFDHFTNHTMFAEKYDPLSQNLFTLKGTEWKKMRSKLTPAFTASKNKLYFETVLKCVGGLLKILDDAAATNEKIDVKELSSRLSVDVITSCAFGLESNSLKNPNSKARKIATDILQSSIRNTIVLLLGTINPKLLSFFKIKFVQEKVSDFFINLMKETISYRETNKVIRQDFIHILLQIRNNVKISEDSLGGFEQKGNVPQLTLEEMAAQSMIFFIGGFETVSTTIMYCLYELSKNVAIQEKARAEIQKCFFEHAQNDQLTYALLQNLPYTDKVIYETLRLYPPVPLLPRECTKDYVIPNTTVRIEKGSFVVVSSLAIHRDPDIFPNPDEFDPERFSPENIKNRHSCAWLPFGVGPRTCIAYQFGLMEIKMALVTILNRYQFKLNSETKQPLALASKTVLLLPDSKIWLNFEKL